MHLSPAWLLLDGIHEKRIKLTKAAYSPFEADKIIIKKHGNTLVIKRLNKYCVLISSHNSVQLPGFRLCRSC